MGKPLAGKQLGLALSDLLGRMKEYRQRDTDCVDDLLAFMAELGYSQLAHQSENAVAMLVLAERQKLRPQWLNAFSHCVGMSEAIEVTPDYEVSALSLQSTLPALRPLSGTEQGQSCTHHRSCPTDGHRS